MLHKQSILIQMDDAIVNQESLTFAFVRIREYFQEFHYNQPPLPQVTNNLIPSNLLITSEDSENGELKGNITFTSLDGKVLYRERWTLKNNS